MKFAVLLAATAMTFALPAAAQEADPIAAVEAEREQATTASNVADFDLAKARQKIEQLANRSDAARENILLAARNANTPLNELPEDEVRSLLEDMKELGLLDDEE